MSLVNGIDMLHRARSNGYAVGAFDVINLEFLEGVLTGAIERRAPLILSLAEMHLDYVDLELFAPALLKAGEMAPIPVSVHLDHGERLETIERALAAGFPSVMFDGSTLPYEENIRLTREVVRMAHSVGAAVEAELGHVGGQEFYKEGRDSGEVSTDDIPLAYTDPDQAADFVQRTECDFLAVSVGTIHGLYRGKPRLDIPRLRQLRQRVSVPLVLHGGSGLSDEEFRGLISNGISKINFYTELSHAATQAVKNVLFEDPDVKGVIRLLGGIKGAVKQVTEAKIAIWGSAGQA